MPLCESSGKSAETCPKRRGRANTGGQAAHPANLCERRDATKKRCQNCGNQYASHHELQCSDAATGRLVNKKINSLMSAVADGPVGKLGHGRLSISIIIGR